MRSSRWNSSTSIPGDANNDLISVEVAPKINIKFNRGAIQAVAIKKSPANEKPADKDSKEKQSFNYCGESVTMGLNHDEDEDPMWARVEINGTPAIILRSIVEELQEEN